MKILGILLLFLFVFIPNQEIVLAQVQEQKQSPVLFLEPSIGFNVSFFKSTAMRDEELKTRDYEEFIVYSLAIGRSIDDFSYSLNLAYAKDIIPFNNDKNQLYAGARSFEYFYQAKFGLTKTLFSKITKRASKISFRGSSGLQFRKYFGKEILGPRENFAQIDSNPLDVSGNLRVSILFDPGEASNIPFKATISPLAVSIGSEATSYEVATLSVILEL